MSLDIDKRLDKASVVKWLIVFGITLTIFLVPIAETYTVQIRNFLCVTIFLILLLVFDLLDIFFIGIMLPMGYIIFNVVPSKIALSGWTNDIAYLVVGAYLFSGILNQSGVLRRIAYWTMDKIGGSYHRMLYGFLIMGMFLNYLTFGNDAALFVFMAYGFAVALNIDKKNEGIVLMMTSGIVSITTRLLTYYPVQMGPMVAAAQTIDPAFSISTFQPILYNAPLNFFAVLFVFIITKIFKTRNENVANSAEYFRTELQQMGKMTMLEKKTIVMTLAIVVYMMTSGLHGLNINYGFMILPCLGFLPGINICGKAALNEVKEKMGMIFFVVGCLGIAAVAAETGATALLSAKIVPMLSGMNTVAVCYCILILGLVGNMLLTPLALVTTLAGPVVQIGSELGMGMMAPLMSLYYTVDILFFPHEVPTYLILFSFGIMSMKQFIGLHALKNALFFVFFGVVIIPWWHLIGIM